MSSWWNSFGGCPNSPTMKGASSATATSSVTTTAPAIATLSRLSLVQAIRPSERPSIDARPAPARTASGVALAAEASTSSGAVKAGLSCAVQRPVRRPGVGAARRRHPGVAGLYGGCLRPESITWRRGQIVTSR